MKEKEAQKTIIIPSHKRDYISSILPAALKKRFRIRRVLGRGAFGIVYLAEDRKIGRLVAIKQLFGDHQKDPEFRKHFLREAKIAGQLAHPNIVIVYNVEEFNHEALIIMEYLGGGSLHDMLQKENCLDFRLATRIMLGILSGLSAAHNIMVVHRDIKPQNIVFSIGTTPKITDFGIARLPMDLSEKEEDETFSGRDSVIGTPLYMSPEQLMMEDTDARSDLYSAGLIYYRMLTGKLLLSDFSNLKIEDLRDKIMNVLPCSVHKYRKDIPREIDKVIFTLLEKKPDNRYPDAESAVKDLLTILSSQAHAEELSELILPSSQVSFAPAVILEDILHILLADKVITPPERAELLKRAERIGISENTAYEIEEKVRKKLKLTPFGTIKSFEEMLESFFFMNDAKIITENQKRILRKKQHELGISDDESNFIISYMSFY